MQKILTAKQIKEVDAFTIKAQQISAVDLMEIAANAFVKAFKKQVSDLTTSIGVLCGTGNNGGDGLAIARLLADDGYRNTTVYLINFSSSRGAAFLLNLDRLSKLGLNIVEVSTAKQIKEINVQVIIDAVLGSGLDRPLLGEYLELVHYVNELDATVIAVDVPTGFPTEGVIPESEEMINTMLTISFQLPKLNFFFPESIQATQNFKVVNINLDQDFINSRESYWRLTTRSDISALLQPRRNFSHKGTYGHALIVAGNENTMGAALLAAKGCLSAGAGLTTVCLPPSGLTVLNTTLPEVMALPRQEQLLITGTKYSGIAIGPGLGTGKQEEEFLAHLIAQQQPLVIDADGLTILSNRKELFDQLAPQSIITPHLKEFDRLFGQHHTWWERVQTARLQAQERNLIIVLKNQYTFICLSNGEVHINPTGNPAMASGGMGDVLTGMLVAFMAQHYPSSAAAVIAVYLHGKAGDELAKQRANLTASQLANQIPKTIKRLKIKTSVNS